MRLLVFASTFVLILAAALPSRADIVIGLKSYRLAPTASTTETVVSERTPTGGRAAVCFSAIAITPALADSGTAFPTAT